MAAMSSSTPKRPGQRGRIRGKDLLSTAEACAYLRIGKTTLRQYIADGRIHPIRLGPKLLRFDPADLDALLS
jgi:excisionase family DNA binding protein